MKKINVQDAIGMELCHDITEMNDGFKGVAFKRGHIIREEDIDHMLRIGKQHIFVWEENAGEIHEDDCARRMAAMVPVEGAHYTEPAEGKVYAPCDATVDMMFTTGHAVSLVADCGAEILIHVGLETVSLEGKPFKVHAANGDKVKKGQLLIEVDLEKVKANPFITEEELLPAEIPDITARIVAFEQQLTYMKEVEKKIKAEKDRLKTAMEKAGVKKWETPNGYKITLIPDAEDKAVKEEYFDAERFMAEHPELGEQYMTTKPEIKKDKTGYVKITAPKEAKS